MTNDDLITMFSDLLQAAREDRITVIMNSRTIEPTNKTTYHEFKLRVTQGSEFSGLSSLVKTACALDLRERLKVAAESGEGK